MFKKYICTLILLYCITNCNSQNKTDIQSILATHNFPEFNNEGKLKGYDTIMTTLFFFKNFILYKIPHNNIDKYDSINKNLKAEYYYFLLKKGEKNGMLFDSMRNINAKTVPADSILKYEFTYNKDYGDSMLIKSSRFINKYFDNTKNLIVKTYVLEPKQNTNYNLLEKDTLKLFFKKKLKNKKFSFSKKIESLVKMNLVAFKIINSKRYFPKEGIILDSFDQHFIYREFKNYDLNEIKKYFIIGDSIKSKF